MKNVPVPVYCRPLVEKDPTMKVSPGLTGKQSKQGEVPSQKLSPGRSGKLGKAPSHVCSSADVPVLLAVVCCGCQPEWMETQRGPHWEWSQA